MNAHDVRHLRICRRCNDIGDGREMIQCGDGLEHQECFMQRNRRAPIKAILALPKAERDKLRLNVIGNRAMRALMNREQQ